MPALYELQELSSSNAVFEKSTPEEVGQIRRAFWYRPLVNASDSAQVSSSVKLAPEHQAWNFIF